MSIRVTMLLCDHAQVAEGKLYINGGGWTLVDAQMPPSAIALIVSVPWDRANAPLELELVLIDEDGRPVVLGSGEGASPIHVSARVEVQRPAVQPAGVPIDVPLVVAIPPLRLQPYARYSWRLRVDGAEADDWSLDFSTRG